MPVNENGPVYSVLGVFDFGKANIATIHTGNDHLTGADLFSVFRHELVTLVQVFQCGITVHFAPGGNTVISEQAVPSLLQVEQKMQLVTGVHQLVRDKIIRFIVELAFAQYIAPFQFPFAIKGKDSHIVRVEADRLVIAETVIPVRIGEIG
jgi:hypothetical protein